MTRAGAASRTGVGSGVAVRGGPAQPATPSDSASSTNPRMSPSAATAVPVTSATEPVAEPVPPVLHPIPDAAMLLAGLGLGSGDEHFLADPSAEPIGQLAVVQIDVREED